jgi:hypothetical protein
MLPVMDGSMSSATLIQKEIPAAAPGDVINQPKASGSSARSSLSRASKSVVIVIGG